MKLLEDFRNGTLPPGTTDEQLWKAQKIKQVCLCAAETGLAALTNWVEKSSIAHPDVQGGGKGLAIQTGVHVHMCMWTVVVTTVGSLCGGGVGGGAKGGQDYGK